MQRRESREPLASRGYGSSGFHSPKSRVIFCVNRIPVNDEILCRNVQGHPKHLPGSESILTWGISLILYTSSWKELLYVLFEQTHLVWLCYTWILKDYLCPGSKFSTLRKRCFSSWTCSYTWYDTEVAALNCAGLPNYGSDHVCIENVQMLPNSWNRSILASKPCGNNSHESIRVVMEALTRICF